MPPWRSVAFYGYLVSDGKLEHETFLVANHSPTRIL